MIIKQIAIDEALELHKRGLMVGVLQPVVPEPKNLDDYEFLTLKKILSGCEFFRIVPEVEKAEAEDATDEEKNIPTASDLGKIGYNSTTYETTFMEAVKGITESKGVSGVINYNSKYVILQGDNVVATTEKPLDDELKEEVKEKVLYNKKVDVMTEGLTAWEEEFNAKTYTDKLKEGL